MYLILALLFHVFIVNLQTFFKTFITSNILAVCKYLDVLHILKIFSQTQHTPSMAMLRFACFIVVPTLKPAALN